MTLIDIDIEDEVIRLAEAGCSRNEIQARMPVNHRRIKMILDEAGFISQSNSTYQINAIWDLDDNERRAAFAKRASEGARRTLNWTVGDPEGDAAI